MGGIEGGLKTNNLLKLPVVKSAAEIYEQIVFVVNQIFKMRESHTDTSLLESKIDSLVYKLYNLSEEEIKIIEN